jgi:hypothetical protein
VTVFALDDIGFYKAPRAMTDSSDGLSTFDEFLDEGDCAPVGAELVGIDLAARENEAIVVRGLDFADEMIDFNALAPVGLVPTLDLSIFDGDNVYCRTCVFEVFFGVGEFDLLVTVGREDSDFLSFDRFVH